MVAHHRHPGNIAVIQRFDQLQPHAGSVAGGQNIIAGKKHQIGFFTIQYCSHIPQHRLFFSGRAFRYRLIAVVGVILRLLVGKMRIGKLYNLEFSLRRKTSM